HGRRHRPGSDVPAGSAATRGARTRQRAARRRGSRSLRAGSTRLSRNASTRLQGDRGGRSRALRDDRRARCAGRRRHRGVDRGAGAVQSDGPGAGALGSCPVSPARARTAAAPDTPHPRQATQLFGHADAEQNLLEAYRSGRMPHAWLIGGLEGIGKATLAYRMARFVLANPDPDAKAVRTAQSLAVATDLPAARRIAAQSHSDLLTLERTVGDTGKMRTEIAVGDVRGTISFFGSTAGAGGWRVCIVDSVDELNRF